MKRNTVLLDLNDYNELNGFRDAIKRGDTVYSTYYDDTWGNHIYSSDEAVKELLNRIGVYEKEIERLLRDIRVLKNPETPEKTIEDIKQMNWFEFRKWKKQNF